MFIQTLRAIRVWNQEFYYYDSINLINYSKWKVTIIYNKIICLKNLNIIYILNVWFTNCLNRVKILPSLYPKCNASQISQIL